MLFHLHLQVWFSPGMRLPSRMVRGIGKQAKFAHYALPEKPNEFSLSPSTLLCFSEPYCIYKTTIPLSAYPFFLPRTFLSIWFFYFLFFAIFNVLPDSIWPFLGVFSVLHFLLLIFFSRLWQVSTFSLSPFPAYSVFLYLFDAFPFPFTVTDNLRHFLISGNGASAPWLLGRLSIRLSVRYLRRNLRRQ
jgi:hypothetical protein